MYFQSHGATKKASKATSEREITTLLLFGFHWFVLPNWDLIASFKNLRIQSKSSCEQQSWQKLRNKDKNCLWFQVPYFSGEQILLLWFLPHALLCRHARQFYLVLPASQSIEETSLPDQRFHHWHLSGLCLDLPSSWKFLSSSIDSNLWSDFSIDHVFRIHLSQAHWREICFVTRKTGEIFPKLQTQVPSVFWCFLGIYTWRPKHTSASSDRLVSISEFCIIQCVLCCARDVLVVQVAVVRNWHGGRDNSHAVTKQANCVSDGDRERFSRLQVKTHQAELRVPVRISCLPNTGNSVRNPVGLMCFEHKSSNVFFHSPSPFFPGAGHVRIDCAAGRHVVGRVPGWTPAAAPRAGALLRVRLLRLQHPAGLPSAHQLLLL